MDAVTASIESKTWRIGELAVSIVQRKTDLTDTEEAKHSLLTKGF